MSRQGSSGGHWFALAGAALSGIFGKKLYEIEGPSTLAVSLMLLSISLLAWVFKDI